MTNIPLVSVVINCYNGELYLREAIDSVYSQTYKNWEIIFWDNASSDRTSEIAKSYDKKLKYFRSSETTILGEARSLATNKAQGDYIAFLDADDIWLKCKLEQQVSVFLRSESKIGFVYGRSKVFFSDKRKNEFIVNDKYALLEGDIFTELLKENFIVFSSVMVNRIFFYNCGGFPKHLLNSTDYWIFINMARKYPCGVIQEVCCKNRIHKTSLSAKQKVVGAQEAIDALIQMLPDERVVSGLKGHYANLVIMHIKELRIFKSIVIMSKHNCSFQVFQRLLNKVKFW